MATLLLAWNIISIKCGKKNKTWFSIFFKYVQEVLVSHGLNLHEL